ncbi:MAG TPA: hypothetical protein VJ997_10375 [Longimicrobiales bacterium]|nr:hypothetical protein [Longimicrobiales bacterium]
MSYVGAPNQCPRCGTLLGEAAHDLKRHGASERRLLRSRKAAADTVFLVGMLLGGPMISFGDNLRIGVFVVLAGALASVLRRYTEWSLPGALAVGSLGALLVAALVVSPAADAYEDTMAAETARQAFVDALSSTDQDLYVEARGVGAVAVWFQAPSDGKHHECGDFPPPEIRAHLHDLGFLRVVVAEQNQSGGLCSFVP